MEAEDSLDTEPAFLFVMTAGLLLNGKNEMEAFNIDKANFECT